MSESERERERARVDVKRRARSEVGKGVSEARALRQQSRRAPACGWEERGVALRAAAPLRRVPAHRMCERSAARRDCQGGVQLSSCGRRSDDVQSKFPRVPARESAECEPARSRRWSSSESEPE